MFVHLAHIQLLMTAGLPFSMLAFHRIVERPTVGRGAALGAVMAAQALSCGYDGVFVILMVGYGVFVVAITRQLWTSVRFWMALAVAALVSRVHRAAGVSAVFQLHRGGFRHALDEANRYSANWSAYLASPAYAHSWLLQFLPPWKEAVFPGFVATILGVAGVWVARRQQRGEVVALYGGLALLAFWTSFGPAGQLYSAFYSALPMFAWLRAPARFGVVVGFALSVLAGVTVSTLLRETSGGAARPISPGCSRLSRPAEHVVPLRSAQVPPVDKAYRMLALSPRGPVIEMPFYYPAVGLFQHTQ